MKHHDEHIPGGIVKIEYGEDETTGEEIYELSLLGKKERMS